MSDKFNPDLLNIIESISNYVTSREEYFSQFDVVVGILNGGRIPTILIRDIVGIPDVYINYSSKSGKGDAQHSNEIPSDLFDDITGTSYRVLVVDEICDTGNTLKEVTDLLRARDDVILVESLVLHNKENDVYTPHNAVQGTFPRNSPWFTYPWE